MLDSAQPALDEYPSDYPYAPQPPRELAEPRPPGRIVQLLVRPPAPELLVLSGAALFNLLIVPLVEAFRPEPMVLAGLAYGVLASELAGLTIWMVWSNTPLWIRLALYWSLLYGLLFCFLISIWLSEQSDPVNLFRGPLCGLPLAALATQLPLWALRMYAGWQIERPGDEARSSARPLSIGDILLGTVIAAVGVAAAQGVASDGRAWLAWAIAIPSIAGVSLASIPAAIYCTLRLKDAGWGAGLLFAYAAGGVIVTLIVVAWAHGGGTLELDFLAALAVMISTLASALWGLLIVAKRRGYVLLFPSDGK
jgi:hypothetical protein